MIATVSPAVTPPPRPVKWRQRRCRRPRRPTRPKRLKWPRRRIECRGFGNSIASFSETLEQQSIKDVALLLFFCSFFFFLFSSSSFSACALREVETESEADYFRFPSSVGQFRFPHGWNQSKQRGLQQFFNLPIASRKRGGRVELHTLESGLDATLPSQKIAISILNDDIACVVDHYLLITSAPS